MMLIVSEDFEATLEGVSAMRKLFRSRFEELRLPSFASENIQLCFSELATNCVKHSRIKPTQINVKVFLSGLNLILEIFDNGSPFLDYKKKTIKKLNPLFHVEETSGRGLGLIDKYLDEHSYEIGSLNKFMGTLNICPKRPRILFIEDDKQLIGLYIQYFSSFYDLKIASSVFEAKKIIENNTFDLIVADYHLGYDDFFQTLDIIEAENDLAVIPILICTAETNPEIKTSLLEHGIVDILEKPVSVSKLQKTIDINISRSLHHRVALFRYFASSINKLLKSKIPSTHCDYALEVAQGSAGIGGGDIILQFSFPDSIRIVVADLMGHGLVASATAISFATMIRSVQTLLHKNLDPGAFLNVVSRLIREDEALSEFMSTFIVVDLHRDGHVDYASAGHLPPLIVNSKRIIHLRESDPIAGVFPADVYHTYSSFLKDGERLCIYTDGVDPQGLASAGVAPEWLIKNLKLSYHSPLDDSVALLEEGILQKVTTTPSDDWTVVLIEKQKAFSNNA